MKRDDRRLRHQDVWELLPWYVNGTLDSDERRAVEAHVERCGLCRSELAASQELASAVRQAADVPPAAEERLDHLLGRLDRPASSASPAAPPPAVAARGSARLPSAVRWALALQAAAILALALGLGYLLALPDAPAAAAAPGAPAFRTLAAPPAAASPDLAVRVVFSPSASERELRHLLLAVGARLEDGPSPAGVYTLEVAGGEDAAAAALERLRRDPLVELAEPVVVVASNGGER